MCAATAVFVHEEYTVPVNNQEKVTYRYINIIAAAAVEPPPKVFVRPQA